MWKKIRTWAEATGAEVLPVNPHRATVDGTPCVPSLAELGAGLDVVAILNADVEAVLDEAVARRAAFVVVFAAGFSETGAVGARRERGLVERLVGHRTRMLGPNTNLNAFEVFAPLSPPAIALVTQSGHQGRPLFQAQEVGVAVSHWAPTGNEADLDASDFIAWFADQPEVGAIAAYLEGCANGRTVRLAFDRAAQAGTPVVAVKVGRSAEGRSMAQSHTGHLTGSDRVANGVLRQHGVTRVDGLDELQDVATMLARSAPPTAPGIAIYGISGGSGAHLADLCGAAGLRLPRLSPTTIRALRECIPGYLRVSNPVDCGGAPAMDERGRRILEILAADPAIGAVVCPLTGALPVMTGPLARDLVAVAATTTKPVCVVWGSPITDDPSLTDVLLPSGLPVFRSFQNCVLALRAWLDWHEFQGRYHSPFDQAPTRPRRRRSELPPLRSGRATVSEHDAKAVLAAYGIDVTRDELVHTRQQAVRAAEAIGLPVVMKVVSPQLPHRSESGLVRIGVSSFTEVRRTYDRLTALASAVAPEATIDGILVGEQVSGGIEIMAGIVHDEVFGPAVTVGLGGTWVEILDDLAVRVPPFDRAEARRMLAETRAARALAGVRGTPPAAVRALTDLLLRLQRLALDLGDDIAELDANPVLVTIDRAVVADALIVPRHDPTRRATPLEEHRP
jgi:acyl-CoA synthetase (NDP forming)